MKQKVKISGYSLFMTFLSMAVMYGALYLWVSKGYSDLQIYMLAAIIAIICLAALYYCPMAISADEKELMIHRSLRIKSIPMSEIASIKLCPATMAERRILGSGGWFGYWGWFRERDLGKYFAYYGKGSDCFLVRLKNGKQYLLGCENPETIVEFVSGKLA